jgi:hypothetical protein
MTRLNLAIAALLLLASAGQINAQSYTLGQTVERERGLTCWQCTEAVKTAANCS